MRCSPSRPRATRRRPPWSRTAAASSRTSSPPRSRSTRPTAASCPSWPRAITSRTSCPWSTQAMARRRRSTFAELDAVAVTQGPGLVGSLLVGVQAAKGIAFVHGKPLDPGAPHRRPHPGPVPRRTARSRCRRWPSSSPAATRSLFEVPGARASTGCSAARATTRPARPSTRSPSCWASAIPGGPVIDRLARGRQRPRGGVHDRAHQGRQAPTSRSAASRPRCSTTCAARASRPSPIPTHVPARDPRPRGLVPARGGRRRCCGASRRRRGARRPQSLLLTGGVAANTLLRAGGGARWRRSSACRSSCRRSRSPPTTRP